MNLPRNTRLRISHRGEEELLSPAAPLAMNPAGPAGSQSASGHHAVDVGVVHQILAPRVEHRQEADFGAEVFGIGRHLLERLCRRPKQDAVHDAFVLECQGTDFFWQGKHHVEVGDRQQLGLPCLQPGCAGYRLALRTVAVAAGVVLDPLVPAFVAALHMSAQFRGPATDDRAQDLTLFRPQRVTVLGDEAGLAITEHIGDF